MRQILLLPTLASILAISSCNNEAKFVHSPPDTTQTISLFVLPKNNVLIPFTDWTIRFTKDSLVFKNAGDEKRTWVRDTTYLVPVIDTIRDAFNNPVKDSTGKILGPQFQWRYSARRHVKFDYNVDLRKMIN